MSLARMTHKEMVRSKREPWVTKRKMVEALTPCLVNLGLKERAGIDDGWDPAEDWSMFVLAIGEGPSSAGGTGGCSLSAG
jgi:hypothetical protein